MVMKQRLVDACLIGDLLHAGAVDAAPDEDVVGGVEDAGLGIRFGLPRRFNHLVRRAISMPALGGRFPLGFSRMWPPYLRRATVSRYWATVFRNAAASSPATTPLMDLPRCMRAVFRNANGAEGQF